MNWQVFLYFGLFSLLGGLVALAVVRQFQVWTLRRIAWRKESLPSARFLEVATALIAGLAGGTLAMALEFVNRILRSL